MMIAHQQHDKQNGSVLIISLVILLVMTMLGITAMGTSTLEEKMAGNDRDQKLAFNAAEAALKQAEDYATNNIVSTAAFDGSTNGLYALSSDPDVDAAATWNTAISYTGTIDKITTPPKFIIEVMGTIGNDDINLGGYGESSGSGVITSFRITARGTGGSDNAMSILQSYYGRKF